MVTYIMHPILAVIKKKNGITSTLWAAIVILTILLHIILLENNLGLGWLSYFLGNIVFWEGLKRHRDIPGWVEFSAVAVLQPNC